jgi:hypothetical protein
MPARSALPAALLALAASVCFAGPSHANAPAPPQASAPAPYVKPWLPASTDSMTAHAARAMGAFQGNAGDSVGGDNYIAYDLVGRLARDLMRGLGRSHMNQVYAIEPYLRSLGFKVDVRFDPEQPAFALVMVRNPYRVSAAAVGFLYWWLGDELKFQGTFFRRGFDPQFHVWWASRGESPYLCAISDHSSVPGETVQLLLLRLSNGGEYWETLQYPGKGPDLGTGVPSWEDINGDGIPELMTWEKTPSDSLFTECRGCPGLFSERLFTLREHGFEPEDTHLVPTAYAAFQRFIRALGEPHGAAAREWAARPSLVDSALALGWGRDRHAGAWHLDYAEPEHVWPHWLVMRHVGASGQPQYAVHFTRPRGSWVINAWIRERYFGPDSTIRALYDAADSAATSNHRRSAPRRTSGSTAPSGKP